MTETAVVAGEGSAESDATAGWLAESAEMLAALGLIGVTGRECSRYQEKTGGRQWGACRGVGGEGRGHALLWPNFEGSLEAPTTAKEGVEKKARAAASPAIFGIGGYSEGSV